jgi:two-component sensor histidine kinase
LLFPFLIWAALRFGSRGACAATLATVVTAITATIHGIGPFTSLSTVENVTALQGLIAVVALSTFALGFAAEELERINTQLDQIVADRTRQLRESLERNEILLKELHHRIKNNLQVVSSILSLHQKSAFDPLMKEKLFSVQGQIGSIATAYDVLQQQQQLQSGEVVDFSKVLQALCSNIAKATSGRVSILTDTSAETMVSADIAVALSLTLNEVITNAIKHVSTSPTVTVSCNAVGNRVSLRITDNGPGLPTQFNFAQTKGFGMRMIRGLIDQIGGDVRFSNGDPGTVVEISAPLLRGAARV